MTDKDVILDRPVETIKTFVAVFDVFLHSAGEDAVFKHMRPGMVKMAEEDVQEKYGHMNIRTVHRDLYLSTSAPEGAFRYNGSPEQYAVMETDIYLAE